MRLRFSLCIAVIVVTGVSFAAQTSLKGEVSVRVITPDGSGLGGISVYLTPAGMERFSQRRTGSTDEDGDFRFTELTPGAYSITLMNAGGYVTPSPGLQDRLQPRLYRLGDTATLTMIKGGVITGRVTNSEGEPLIAMPLTAIMVRGEEIGQISNPASTPFSQAFTDDRGIYRMYGLPPGVYIVMANTGNPYSNSQASLYDFQVPTYYPSSTRDTAVEVRVTSGGEASGIDIRYRGGRGHAISGSVVGPSDTISVILSDFRTRSQVASAYIFSGTRQRTFDLYGIPDGEYELHARTSESGAAQPSSSDTRRISIRGVDATGVELRLLPLGSVAGRMVLETPQSSCDKASKVLSQEVYLQARPEEKAISSGDPIVRPLSAEGRVDEKGGFEIRGLSPHRYRFWVNLPGENLFVKSISMDSVAASTAQSTASDLGRHGLLVRRGDKVLGVAVTIADGAASLRGRVTSQPGVRLPHRVRVYSVPVAPTSADDVLRYSEAIADSEGRFALTALAPGSYWLLARSVPDDEPLDRSAPPRAWDPAERVRLRREAEAIKNEVEVKACQRVVDIAVKYVEGTGAARP